MNTPYQYEFTGYCETCKKKMWKRDKLYSLRLFGEVYCARHVPEFTLTGRKVVGLKK